MKLSFFEVVTAIKVKLCDTPQQLHRRKNLKKMASVFVDECVFDCKDEQELSTQFLPGQIYKIIDIQEHFERCYNLLPVYGFNSATSDINLIQPYFFPTPVNEQDGELTVIKKANRFVPFNFGHLHLLEVWNSLVELKVVILFSNLRRLIEPGVSFFTSGSFVQRC